MALFFYYIRFEKQKIHNTMSSMRPNSSSSRRRRVKRMEKKEEKEKKTKEKKEREKLRERESFLDWLNTRPVVR